MKFFQWLKSLFNREKEKMSDQSVTDTTATDTTTAADATTGTASTDTGIVATVERDLGQFFDIVKELTERFGAEYKELAIDFAKAVSVKK